MKLIAIIVTLLAICAGAQAGEKKHLFILTGQSNMHLLNPELTFRPMVEKEFGKESVIIVKDAMGGQRISRWCKTYKDPRANAKKREDEVYGELYDRLMTKVKEAVGDKKIDTVTLIWMQGEGDANKGLQDAYAESFKGILSQLKADLGKETIYFVIGRISDCGVQTPGTKQFDNWTRMREIQVKLAEEDKHGEWIDTDDCNDGMNKARKEVKNDLHMSIEGYKKMGERFAEKAIALINGTVNKD